ncbi:conserved Plasmodium protein, unknown function [Plasmodium ovale]|uniref:Rad51-like C-terminal domain-containing protein n=2 Tax=Plasmodium ovale TaxID=36330 RepID=A0A1A8VLV6_PLAOA|nr:conserved Plasmodium protein, unknown function [Plasmodium ovale curtisi]SBS83111.1 conserved Plasmodium protein, unknown function [Plasmodium ovale curtisi]SCA48708.1 conserved Plasmodium protein, unknown function [Plasmodium ovale]
MNKGKWCRTTERIFQDGAFNKMNRRKLTFECDKLNSFFEDGIPNYSLIELMGSPGSGKTQFALTLCAEQLLKTYEEKRENIIFYIYINRTFPMARLTEIVESKLAKMAKKGRDSNHFPQYSPTHLNGYHECGGCEFDERKNQVDEFTSKGHSTHMEGDDTLRNILKNLYIQKVNNYIELFTLLQRDMFYIAKYYKISLLVVDSFNCIINDNANFNSWKRQNVLIEMSIILKQISYQYDMFILVINTLPIQKDNAEILFNSFDYFTNSFCSNTIINFTKTKEYNHIHRKIIVKLSDFLSKYKSLNFEITHEGFIAL